MPAETSHSSSGGLAADSGSTLDDGAAVGLRTVVHDTLAGLLPPDQLSSVVERLNERLEANISIAAVSATMMHQGPLPPVHVAEGYERLLPGSVDRLFKMAETEQSAFIEAQRDVRKRADRFRIIALATGAVALMAILGATVWLAKEGHGGVAATVAGIGIATIVATFVNAGSPLNVGRRQAEGQQPEPSGN